MEGKMTVVMLDPRHDANNDEMRFPYPLTGEPDREVRVPRSAIVNGIPWIKERIEGYFIDHPRPEPGASMRIPDYQFEVKLFQPSRIPGSGQGMKRRTKGRPRRSGSNRGSGRSIGSGSSHVGGQKRPKRRQNRRSGRRG